MISSTISDVQLGVHFLSVDLKDYFLASPMRDPKYMKILLTNFPPDIISHYNLLALAHNGYVYIKIKKGVYGLKQAAILAYKKLVDHLKPFSYAPFPFSLGLWTHTICKTVF